MKYQYVVMANDYDPVMITATRDQAESVVRAINSAQPNEARSARVVKTPCLTVPTRRRHK